MPLDIVYGFAYLKKKPQPSPNELGVLPPKKKRPVFPKVCERILKKKARTIQFPFGDWADRFKGTQSNMNFKLRLLPIGLHEIGGKKNRVREKKYSA